jgi:hypothetical protein
MQLLEDEQTSQLRQKPLCLIKHCIMESMFKNRVIPHTVLTSAIVGAKRLVSRRGRFSSVKSAVPVDYGVVLTHRPIWMLLLKTQDRQYTYNEILRRVHESVFAVESNKYYIFVCACVRAC